MIVYAVCTFQVVDLAFPCLFTQPVKLERDCELVEELNVDWSQMFVCARVGGKRW